MDYPVGKSANSLRGQQTTNVLILTNFERIACDIYKTIYTVRFRANGHVVGVFQEINRIDSVATDRWFFSFFRQNVKFLIFIKTQLNVDVTVYRLT